MLVYITYWIDGNVGTDVASVLLVMMLLGAAFSSPSALILYLIADYLSKRLTSLIIIKLLLTVISGILTMLPFWLLGDFKVNYNDLKLYGPYCGTIILSIWLYRLELVNNFNSKPLSA